MLQRVQRYITNVLLSCLLFAYLYSLLQVAASPSSITPFAVTGPTHSASTAKPDTLKIVPPWQGGEKHVITTTYEEFIHYTANCAGTGGNAKDCYALDFPGRFSVTAIADATLVYAGWASGGFGRYGQIIYLCHGKHKIDKLTEPVEICSFYAHFEQIDDRLIRAYRAGENLQVSKGQYLGISGASGCNSLSYWRDNKSSDHLHFSIHADSKFQIDRSTPPKPCGQSGGTGPAFGYAVVPEPFEECVKDDKLPCEDFFRKGTLTRTSTFTGMDVVFAIDTTSSMLDDIDAVKIRAAEIIDKIKLKDPSSRIAVVEFRDYPSRTFFWGDYPYRDVLPFTTNSEDVKRSINSLTLGSGGDARESQYCALMHIITGDLCAGRGAQTSIGSWRLVSSKSIIVLTDAPPLSPEPFTNFTIDNVTRAALQGGVALDESAYSPGFLVKPAQNILLPAKEINIFPVIIGNNSDALLSAQALATNTQGRLFSVDNAAQVVDAILSAIDVAGARSAYLPLVVGGSVRAPSDIPAPTIAPTVMPTMTSFPSPLPDEVQAETPIPTLTPTATSVPLDTPTATLSPVTTSLFQTVDLSGIMNRQIDHLLSPPYGANVFEGVPFTIINGERSVFHTQGLGSDVEDLPTSIAINVAVNRPRQVHILLNGGYVEQQYSGKTIGFVLLYFDDGLITQVGITAGETIRETWAYVGSPDAEPLLPVEPNVRWHNVFSEDQYRGSMPAKGYIDMLTITIPDALNDAQLHRIEVLDNSLDTVGSKNPSLILMGITIESAP